MLSKQTKRFSSVLPKIENEISDVISLVRERNFFAGNYNLHRVPVGGKLFLVADAKAMNRFDHQSGRGCWRYLINPETMQYSGIAREVDNGSYKMIS